MVFVFVHHRLRADGVMFRAGGSDVLLGASIPEVPAIGRSAGGGHVSVSRAAQHRATVVASLDLSGWTAAHLPGAPVLAALGPRLPQLGAGAAASAGADAADHGGAQAGGWRVPA